MHDHGQHREASRAGRDRYARAKRQRSFAIIQRRGSDQLDGGVVGGLNQATKHPKEASKRTRTDPIMTRSGIYAADDVLHSDRSTSEVLIGVAAAGGREGQAGVDRERRHRAGDVHHKAVRHNLTASVSVRCVCVWRVLCAAGVCVCAV